MSDSKILLIDRASFIDWFFDEDMISSFFEIYNVTSELSETGTFTITAQHLLDNVGFLPGNLAAEGQEVILNQDEEIDLGAYTEIKFA